MGWCPWMLGDFIAYYSFLMDAAIKTAIQAQCKDVQTAQKDKKINLWRSGLAWQITFSWGLQSFIFYTVITWMPEILEQKGLNADEAGWMLSIMQLAVIP